MAEVVVEQRSHRALQPGRQVDAVGDMVYRHLVGRASGVERLPHCPRDLAMAPADTVGVAAGAQCESGQADRRVGLVRICPAERQQLLMVG